MRLFLLTGVLIVACTSVLLASYMFSDKPLEKDEGVAIESASVGTEETQSAAAWKKEKVPLDKSGEMIIFGDDGYTVIVGNGTILFSRDGGKTWKALTGGRGEHRLTTDGGGSYRYINAGQPQLATVDVNSLCGVENAVINSSGRLFIKTSCEHTPQLWSIPLKNEADAWYVVSFTNEDNSSSGVYAPSTTFVLAGDRVLIEGSLPGSSAILTTDDNGATWRSFWSSSHFGAGLSAFDFKDANTGWLLLGSGELSKTTNGGDSWNKVSTLPSVLAEDAYSLRFVDTKTGFIVGFKGLILATNDGGLTWRRQRSNITFDLYKVVATDTTHAWASGTSNIVLQTSDGGKAWQKVKLETDNHIAQRLSVKDGLAWVCFDKFIFHSQ